MTSRFPEVVHGRAASESDGEIEVPRATLCDAHAVNNVVFRGVRRTFTAPFCFSHVERRLSADLGHLIAACPGHSAGREGCPWPELGPVRARGQQGAAPRCL